MEFYPVVDEDGEEPVAITGTYELER